LNPEELAAALRERFPAPYSLSFGQIAETVLEILDRPAPAPVTDLKLSREQAEKLLADTELPRLHPLVDAGKAPLFEQKKCQHCGGLHVRKCPAVKEIEYHPDGKVMRVVYFAQGEWSDEDVIWLEDVYAALGGDDGEE
jgi:hypothetical protein